MFFHAKCFRTYFLIKNVFRRKFLVVKIFVCNHNSTTFNFIEKFSPKDNETLLFPLIVTSCPIWLVESIVISKFDPNRTILLTIMGNMGTMKISRWIYFNKIFFHTVGKELLLWVETRALNYTNDMITTAAGQHNLGFRDYDWCTPPLYYVIKTIKALMFYKKHWISRVCHTAKSLWIQYNGKQSYPERLPNVTNVPKNTLGPQFDFIQSS